MSDVGEREGRYLGKVLWHVTMSLDGFISGPGNAMDWAYDTVPNETVADVIRTTGALIVGRSGQTTNLRFRFAKP